jgi:formylglycine-generating enzyme required for sulfatase activity
MVSEEGGMTLMYVPAGNFLMGSLDIDSDWPNDKPQHMVTLDAYWIDQTEVTNNMDAQCVSAGNCRPPSAKNSQTLKPSEFAGRQGRIMHGAWLRHEEIRAICSSNSLTDFLSHYRYD